MNKKGKINESLTRLGKIKNEVKRTYLYKLISGFLSVACTIILIALLLVGGVMFFFNMKAKSCERNGTEFTAPFGLYTIISPSMEPNVSVYDVIVAVDTDISKIKVGDVITFISDWDVTFGLTVTHRVVAISKTESGEYRLTTKGDNNGNPDGGVVTQKNLVGKVVGRIPQLGRLQFFLATKMGWFFVVFIPALIIIIVDMIKIFKLYVLKGKIDNVKPQEEAKKEEIEKILDAKDEELKEPNKEILKPRERVIEDKNIDTVELPKIDRDGVIKESTIELPTVKPKMEEDDEAKESIGDMVLSPIEELIDETTKMPTLNRESEDLELDQPRKMLKRRDK